MSALLVRGLSAGYGGPPVLRSIDLTVADGALACLLGPSGSGKSTLLRCLAGLLPTESGTVMAGGRRLDDLPPERRRVGLVPQDAALFTHLDVERNVGYGLNRLSRPERRDRVAELLELTGLTGLQRRMPYELSGGQQQRVALARALAPRPELLLLDEPFSGLDPQLRVELRDQVRAVLTELRTTALLVSHDRDEALSTVDQVVVMREGEIRQAGTPVEIYRYPADPWTGRFVGDAIILSGVADDAHVRCALGRLPAVGDHGGPPSGPVTVLLRPEQLRLRPATSAPVSTRGPVEVTVTAVAYRGRDWRIDALTDSGESVLAWWLDDPDAADDPGGTSTPTPVPGTRLAVDVSGPALIFAPRSSS